MSAVHALTKVVTTRHVPRLLGSMLLGRLPAGMGALAVVLVVRGQGGDYAVAGVLAGVYAAGQAVGAPVLARAVDRWRQTPPLLVGALASAAGFVVFGFVDVTAHPLVSGLAVLVAGAATPPIEPCLRVLWSDLLPDGVVHAAYSLDTASQELIFTFGPLIVLGAVAVAGPVAGVVAAAAVGLAGTLAFATARPSRAWQPITAERHWAGPLRSARLVRLLFTVACVGFAIGVFTVAVTAHAEQVATRSASAWLLAANAFGALAGGLVNATARPARDPSGRLFRLMGLFAAGYLPLVFAPGLLGTMPLAFLSGLALPPVLAVSMVLVDTFAPAGTVTEAFAWVVTAFGVGNGIGSGVAGAVLDATSYPVAMLLAVAGGAAGALLALGAVVMLRGRRPGRP
ncbi:MAG TPA: MFS transporter [Streptosporangiales bacterium]